jgi:hypothetical protein
MTTFRPQRFILLAGVAAASCGRSSSATAPTGSATTLPLPEAAPPAGSSASTSPSKPGPIDHIPAIGPVTVNLEGRGNVVLPTGIAEKNDDGIRVLFSNGPLSCDETNPSTGLTIGFTIPAGPGRAYFVGKLIHVGISTSAPQLQDAFALQDSPPHMAIATVDARPGGRVHGALQGTARSSPANTHGPEIYASAIGGIFDVTICPNTWPPSMKVGDAVPPEPPTGGPVKGRVAGQPFLARSALAFVWHDANPASDHIRTIEFYPDAGVTCAKRTAARESIDVSAFAGGSSVAPEIGVAEPASLAHDLRTLVGGRSVGFKSADLGTHSWVTFDKMAFEAGDVVSGSVVMLARLAEPPEKQVAVGGRFEATVCAMGTRTMPR